MEASANGAAFMAIAARFRIGPTNSNTDTLGVEIRDHEVTVWQDLHADDRSAALRD
jgi:hypothetical protein